MIEDLTLGDWVSLVSAIAAVGAIVLATIALRVNRRQLHAFEWNQARATIDLAKQWNSPENLAVRGRLRKRMELNSGDAIGLAKLQRRKDWPDIRRDMVTHLNFLEIVSVSLQKDLIDEEMSYQLFGQIIVQASTAFHDFMVDFRARHDHPGTGVPRWGNIDRAARIFRAKAENEAKMLPDDAVDAAVGRLHKRTLDIGHGSPRQRRSRP